MDFFLMYLHMYIRYTSHMLTSCDGLNVNGCHSPICLTVWSLVGGTTLETIRYGLVRGGMSLGVELEVSKTHARPSPSLPSNLGLGCKLPKLLQSHVCLPVVKVTAMMIMETAYETVSKSPVKCFHCVP